MKVKVNIINILMSEAVTVAKFDDDDLKQFLSNCLRGTHTHTHIHGLGVVLIWPSRSAGPQKQ